MSNRVALAIDLVQLKGSYYEIGKEQGKQIAKGSDFQALKSLNQHVHAQTAVDQIMRFSPGFYEELAGLAEGLEEDVSTVIQMYSGYDVNFPSMGCTTLAQNTYYVRNYDFSPELYDGRFVFSNPENGYASVGFSQQLVGRLDGMNEKGLVIGLHFVNQQHRGEGFLATTIVRLVLDLCKDVDEAIDLIKKIPHGYCYNYSIFDKNGKHAIVEASPEEQVAHFPEVLICTNHFESELLKSKNMENMDGSLRRKDYLQNNINIKIPPLDAYRLFNAEDSPLFFKYYKEYFGTLHTVLYSPTDLKVMVGIGGNCEPFQFHFQDWIEGKVEFPESLKGTIHI